MAIRPADLTMIARRNGGQFDAERVARLIDGRAPLKGHARGEMPVWGSAFASADAGGLTVEQKIERLVSYLSTLQAK